MIGSKSDISIAATPKNSIKELRYPITPIQALNIFQNSITENEQEEILHYTSIYYVGQNAIKLIRFDDDNGDYQISQNDHIAYRYEILGLLGSGSFGKVVKAFDHKHRREIAIKIIRNHQKFYQQAKTEIKILKLLRQNDTRNEYNIVHILDYFIFRNHVCICFELLNKNLYEFLKENRHHGLYTNIIRRIAIQILKCLINLKKHQIIHCDLKPENILLKNQNQSDLKVIDFGSSCFNDQRVFTYIQSRFYRAPEIVLGIGYTSAIDMWSFGCILAELQTGYPLFPAENEHELLQLIMEIFGVPQYQLIHQGKRSEKFFDSDLQPILIPNRHDKIRYPSTRKIEEALKGCDSRFIDLIQRCLDWNPQTRITPEEALQHFWITDNVRKSREFSYNLLERKRSGDRYLLTRNKGRRVRNSAFMNVGTTGGIRKMVYQS